MKDVAIVQVGDKGLEDALAPLLYSLSETSQRQYQYTFSLWAAFCKESDSSLYMLSGERIVAFLESMEAAHSTKKNRLTHMRRLLEALHAAWPNNEDLERFYKQIQLIRLKRNSSEKENQRHKTALKKREVYAALEVWSDNTNQHLRNRALLAVLLYQGLRRSEAAALKWEDIDFDEGLLTVQHGKGDKKRVIPLLSDEVVDSLLNWRESAGQRSYIFCAVLKNDKPGKDRKMSEQAIYAIVETTALAINKEFSPHDARRTLITEMLISGTNVADAQFIAGHARPDTTLGYAQIGDAKEVKARVKIRY